MMQVGKMVHQDILQVWGIGPVLHHTYKSYPPSWPIGSLGSWVDDSEPSDCLVPLTQNNISVTYVPVEFKTGHENSILN